MSEPWSYVDGRVQVDCPYCGVHVHAPPNRLWAAEVTRLTAEHKTLVKKLQRLRSVCNSAQLARVTEMETRD